MKRLLIALVLLTATAFGQSVGTVFFQASYSQSSGTVATPTFNNGTGSYSGSATVTISDSTDSASIFYCTAVGSDCTPGTAYTVPVVISVTNTHLCANATKSGYMTSATACATYTITAAASAPAFVQQCNSYQSWGTTVACTINGVGAGNVLMIAAVTGDTITPSGMADSNGTVSALITNVVSSALTRQIRAYSVVNAASGTHTITVTIASSNAIWLSVAEYSGAAASPVDAYATLNCASACSNPSVTGTLTTTQANETIWAFGLRGSGTTGFSAGSGWATHTSNQSSTNTVLEDKATTTAGTYTAEWTNTGVGAVIGIGVSLKHP